MVSHQLILMKDGAITSKSKRSVMKRSHSSGCVSGLEVENQYIVNRNDVFLLSFIATREDNLVKANLLSTESKESIASLISTYSSTLYDVLPMVIDAENRPACSTIIFYNSKMCGDLYRFYFRSSVHVCFNDSVTLIKLSRIAENIQELRKFSCLNIHKDELNLIYFLKEADIENNLCRQQIDYLFNACKLRNIGLSIWWINAFSTQSEDTIEKEFKLIAINNCNFHIINSDDFKVLHVLNSKNLIPVMAIYLDILLHYSLPNYNMFVDVRLAIDTLIYCQSLTIINKTGQLQNITHSQACCDYIIEDSLRSSLQKHIDFVKPISSDKVERWPFLNIVTPPSDCSQTAQQCLESMRASYQTKSQINFNTELFGELPSPEVNARNGIWLVSIWVTHDPDIVFPISQELKISLSKTCELEIAFTLDSTELKEWLFLEITTEDNFFDWNSRSPFSKYEYYILKLLLLEDPLGQLPLPLISLRVGLAPDDFCVFSLNTRKFIWGITSESTWGCLKLGKIPFSTYHFANNVPHSTVKFRDWFCRHKCAEMGLNLFYFIKLQYPENSYINKKYERIKVKVNKKVESVKCVTLSPKTKVKISDFQKPITLSNEEIQKINSMRNPKASSLQIREQWLHTNDDHADRMIVKLEITNHELSNV